MPEGKDRIKYIIILILGLAAYHMSTYCGQQGFAAAWIWPALFLYYTRYGKGKIVLPLLWVVLLADMFVYWRGVSGAGVLTDLLLIAALAALTVLPFAADRYLYRALRKREDGSGHGIALTLMFPLMCAAFDFLRSYTPFGTVCMLGYSQNGIIPVERAAGAVGIMGLTFIMAWFASLAVNIAAERKYYARGALVKANVPLFLAAAALIEAAAYAPDIADKGTETETMRIALSVGPQVQMMDGGEYEVLPLEENISALNSLTQTAAAGDAELLAFNEEAFCIYDYQVQEITEAACAAARENGMYMFLPLEIRNTEQAKGSLDLNEVVIINENGDIEREYLKHHLVPVMESGKYTSGDGNIPVLEFEAASGTKSKIATVICYDSDFPQYLTNIPADTDIIVMPAWEWVPIIDFHFAVMTYRAMEHGCTLIKPTYDGITAISDSRGNILLKAPGGEAGYNFVKFAEIPVKGIKTLYGIAGRYMDFIYPLGLCIVLLAVFEKKKRAV